MGEQELAKGALAEVPEVEWMFYMFAEHQNHYREKWWKLH